MAMHLGGSTFFCFWWWGHQDDLRTWHLTTRRILWGIHKSFRVHSNFGIKSFFFWVNHRKGEKMRILIFLSVCTTHQQGYNAVLHLPIQCTRLFYSVTQNIHANTDFRDHCCFLWFRFIESLQTFWTFFFQNSFSCQI